MDFTNYMGWGHMYGAGIPFLLPFLIPFMLWSLFWKGLAMWYAAQRGHTGWFVAILLINTMGILEIVYLFLILKMTFSDLFGSKKTGK